MMLGCYKQFLLKCITSNQHCLDITNEAKGTSAQHVSLCKIIIFFPITRYAASVLTILSQELTDSGKTTYTIWNEQARKQRMSEWVRESTIESWRGAGGEGEEKVFPLSMSLSSRRTITLPPPAAAHSDRIWWRGPSPAATFPPLRDLWASFCQLMEETPVDYHQIAICNC